MYASALVLATYVSPVNYVPIVCGARVDTSPG